MLTDFYRDFSCFTRNSLLENTDFEAGTLLLVDKPLRWTSFDVVNKIRFKLRAITGNKKIKVGHAGTLDPLATGLLLICTGKNTRRIDELMGLDKSYTGTIGLGFTTPSYDLECEPDAHYPTEHITPELISAVRMSFEGPQMQIPPVYSAIKVEGQKSYAAARKGEIKKMEPRAIVFHNLGITAMRLPEAIDFESTCSKGTYIRSLAYDFGMALNSGGTLTALRRTAIGPFKCADAWPLPDLIQLLDIDPRGKAESSIISNS